MLKHECATRQLAPLPIVILLLSGCATANFECPIPKEYSAEVQGQVADELEALPDGSLVAELVADYGVLRAQSRACRGGGAQ